MEKSDNKLVRKAIKGDNYAFSMLFLKLQNKLYRIAYSRLKSDDDTKDAIQNTILITYNSLNKLKKIESFESWVIKILINECNKILNSNKKVIYSEDNVLELNSYSDDFDDLFFSDLIKKLSTKEQVILTLYYLNNYSIEEISDELGLKAGTIKSVLHRSRNKLKKLLEEN